MDIETIRALAELPTIAILIYLLVRAQTQNEKLLAGMIESEREHARNLVDIMCHGGGFVPNQSGMYRPAISIEPQIPKT